MTRFNIAHQTYRGHAGLQADYIVSETRGALTWVMLAHHSTVSLPPAATTSADVLAVLGPAASLCLCLNETALTLEAAAQPELWHYFRLCDATLTPLGPSLSQPLRLQRGDAYVALSPGARHLTDSPTLARFIHLRDYFTASSLARAILTHIEDTTRTHDFPVDVTALVVEAR